MTPGVNYIIWISKLSDPFH